LLLWWQLFSPHAVVTGQLYGLEKFWAFLKYTRKQNIEVDAKLTGYLSKFKRLEDFRIQVSCYQPVSFVPELIPCVHEDCVMLTLCV